MKFDPKKQLESAAPVNELGAIWDDQVIPEEKLPVVSEALEQSVAPFRTPTNLYDVQSYWEANIVGATVQRVGIAKRWVDAHHGSIIEAAKATLAAACAARDRLWNPLDRLERELKAALKVFETDQEEQRRQQQVDRERAVKEEMQRKRDSDVQALREAGEETAADLLAAAPIYVPPIEIERPEIAGLRKMKPVYKARVVDLKVLAKAVGAGKVSLQAIAPNQSWLNGEAKQRGKNLQIPGVEIYEEIPIGRKP